MNKKKKLWVPVVVVIAVIAFWVISGCLLYGRQDRGTFGDMFGAVNALFSGLAFAGVVFAILLQQQELSLQKSELTLTRCELEGQKKALELQNKTLQIQNFENTFFQLLRLLQEIINSIDLREKPTHKEISKGRDCMRIFYLRFEKKWKKMLPGLSGDSEEERINLTYNEFFRDVQEEIGHYFRSLYHIIKLVDQSAMDNKRLYTDLVRAQLSTFELKLLFYYAFSDLGSQEFKPLIEKYALFEYLPVNLLLAPNPDRHKKLYAEGAYK